MTRAWRVVISIAFLFAMSGFAICELRAQTIHVDAAAEHATNTIVPTQALRAGIDRLPYGASDKLLTEENIERELSPGWQTVTYRQNTIRTGRRRARP